MTDNLLCTECADEFDEVGIESPFVEVRLTVGDEWQQDPLRLIAGIREGARNLDEWQRSAVTVAREQGHSWEEIGTACGISKQAAWERFSRARES